MPSLFFSYCHVDEELRDRLEKQFATLKRQGIIDTWHDRRIGAGAEIDKAIDARINTDDIILLLVSPDFINSDYCYDKEMTRALERHDRGEAIVIPVILRPCDWHPTPFGKLNAVPRDGKPITRWPDMDEAMLQVALAVRQAASRLSTSAAPRGASTKQASSGSAPGFVMDMPRSSNLSIARTFTQRDKDRFRSDAFEFLAKFFENSLAELGARNPDVEGVFERVDSGRFFATIYRSGAIASQATVYMGRDHWRPGSAMSSGNGLATTR